MATKKWLNLFIITMIISIFGALSAIGGLAEESTFGSETVEGVPIIYTVTNDGVFKEVEVVSSYTTFDVMSIEEIARPEKITIPETVVYNNIGYTVTSVGEGAFSRHTNLSHIDLPDTLKLIKDGAFYMTGLTAVEIPKSVTNIGKYAFANCFDLTTVICLNQQPVIIDSTSFVNIDYINYADPNQVEDEWMYNSDLKIYIPSVSKDAYVETGWPEDYLIPVYNFSL